MSCGFLLCMAYPIQIYIMVKNADEELKTATQFAILVLTWGELILLMTINLLAFRIYLVQHEIMYAQNQMFRYHTQVRHFIHIFNAKLLQKYKLIFF